MTHFYGLFEAMLRDNQIQPYPDTYNYTTSNGASARSPPMESRHAAQQEVMALLDTLQAPQRDAGSDDGRLPGGDATSCGAVRPNGTTHTPSPHSLIFYTPNRTITALLFQLDPLGRVAWKHLFSRLAHALE